MKRERNSSDIESSDTKSSDIESSDTNSSDIESSDTRCYVITHSVYNIPAIDRVYPIQAGSSLTEHRVANTSPDNSLENNISDKNRNYCELTAIYHIWQSKEWRDNNSIIIIDHYRRFLLGHKSSLCNRHVLNYSKDRVEKELPQSIDAIERRLTRYDAILPTAKWKTKKVERDYIHYHIREDWQILKEVVLELHPTMAANWKRYLSRSTKFHKFNIIACRAKLFQEYCEWLFPILFQVEKRIKISAYPYQARVFGFMAERLLTLFIQSRGIKYTTSPVAIV